MDNNIHEENEDLDSVFDAVEDSDTVEENPETLGLDYIDENNNQEDLAEIEQNEYTTNENSKPFELDDPNESPKPFEHLTTEEKTKNTKPFATEKINAEAAMDEKPPILNRKLILTVIGTFFSLFIVFSVLILPMLNQKKIKDDKAKLKTTQTQTTITDYSALVPRDTKQEIFIYEEKDDVEQFEELDEDGLPPVNDKYTYSPPQQEQINTFYSETTTTGKIRPDTSEDSLQSLSISGIKGISNTQRQYLSDSNTISQTTTNTTNPYASFGMPDKDTYTQQMLSGMNTANTANQYTNQNDQSGKNLFYETNKGNINGQWLPLNTIWQGSIFEAVLTSNINTDLPGECTAVITKNIYSSQDGSLLLIPQNSKLYGSYNSSISYSQKRAQVGWHTLIRPDGYQLILGNMSATDAQGAAGLKGFVNDHPFQYLKALALISAFNIVSTEINGVSGSTENQYVQNVAANTQEVANTLGSKIIDRAMDVQPTLTIKSGTRINIVANTTLTLPPFENIPVTQPYRR